MPPHQAFEEEVALLDSFFPGKKSSFSFKLICISILFFIQKIVNAFFVSDGEAYCLGSVDSDCWYLYTLNRENFNIDKKEPDQTLEILMTNLNPDIMSIFTRDICSSASEATQKSGIDKLIPSMMIDDFLFEPCGYSMNGVSKSVRKI